MGTYLAEKGICWECLAPTGTRDAFGECNMARQPSIRDFLTNLDQPMPVSEKLGKLVRNLWRRVALRQDCCGHLGEPGC
jgi:hypothetical protein